MSKNKPRKKEDYNVIMQSLKLYERGIIFMMLLYFLFLIVVVIFFFKPQQEPTPHIVNISSCNYSYFLTLKFIGKYCKEHEPEGYKLNVWWNGCERQEKASFECGYVNSDGAMLYKCFKWEDIFKEYCNGK